MKLENELLYVVPVYLNCNKWNEDFDEHDCCLEFGCENIVIIGDFNARTGDLQAITEARDTLGDFANLARRAKDAFLDRKGIKLVEMCETLNLLILNGRTQSDSEGNFTYMRGQACSTIDYCLVRGIWRKLVRDLTIEEAIYSDHLPLVVDAEMAAKEGTQEVQNQLLPKLRWNNRLASLYTAKLDTNLHDIVISGEADENLIVKFNEHLLCRAKEKVCLTMDCIQTASFVLRLMKPEADPCDDFYEFACGAFLNETVIPDDEPEISVYYLINDRLQEQLKELITQKRSLSDPKNLRLPNLLYKACMNKSLLNELGSGPIRSIADSLGGWPVLMGRAWDANNSWSWQEAVKKFRGLGFDTNYMIDFSIGIDIKNTTKRLMNIDKAVTGLHRAYLVQGFNEALVTSYFSYMVNVAVLFGADKAVAITELGDSLQFEMDLANISLQSEERRNPKDLYNPSTIRELQKAYPYVQWLDYINALMPNGLTVEEDEPINVSEPTFFAKLARLLAETPKRVIANYMMWRIHAKAMPFLSDEFRKSKQEYDKALYGREEQRVRWKQCVERCSHSLPIAVGSLYVRKHFKEDSKVEAKEMVKNIREIYHQLLDELDWMDDKTKKRAKAKLHAMATHIGYPDELLDDSKMAAHYQNLSIDPERYLESFLRINVFKTDYSFNKLRLPVNKTEWQSHALPAIVNAFYSPEENSIEFPAGILQGYFFNPKRPRYMNYGGIGFVIGHEITHAFDDEGRHFDLDGNLVDWWEPQTEENYLKKAKCINDQYGNYTEPLTGLDLNGITTLGENIADNGGFKESYLAYKNWAAKNGLEPKLPGLDYSPEQMFWISGGQAWCSKSRKESVKMAIKTYPHSPDYFRVIGSLRNIKYFAKDFHCPEGSPMNPVEKCEFW